MKKIQKRTKVINVTQRDIKLGEQDNPESCPIARALARSFHKGVGSYSVWGKTITFPSCREVKAPKEVNSFVKNFDSAEEPMKTINPFTFTLEY